MKASDSDPDFWLGGRRVGIDSGSSMNIASKDSPFLHAVRATDSAEVNGVGGTEKLSLHTWSVDEVSGFPCATIGGATSAFICVCHSTNIHMVYLVKARDQFPNVLAALMAEVESLGDYKIYRVWSDSAPEIQAGRARIHSTTSGSGNG